MDTRTRPFSRGGNGSFAVVGFVLCKGAVLWGFPLPYLRSVYQRTLIINKYGQGWMSEDKRAHLLTSAATRSCADFTTERDSNEGGETLRRPFICKRHPRVEYGHSAGRVVGVFITIWPIDDATVNGNGGLLVCR